jgi:hypothetical protein
MFTPPLPPIAEKAVVAQKAANANQKKAVEACASRQRLPVSGEEFVTLLWWV